MMLLSEARPTTSQDGEILRRNFLVSTDVAGSCTLAVFRKIIPHLVFPLVSLFTPMSFASLSILSFSFFRAAGFPRKFIERFVATCTPVPKSVVLALPSQNCDAPTVIFLRPLVLLKLRFLFFFRFSSKEEGSFLCFFSFSYAVSYLSSVVLRLH